MRGEGSSVGTMGVPHHVWVLCHPKLLEFFTCTAASSVFTLQDKGKAHWMLLEMKQISHTNRSLSLLCSRMVLQAGRSRLQWAAVWCTAILPTTPAAPWGLPMGALHPAWARPGRDESRDPPASVAAAGHRQLGQTSALCPPSC